jgi:hypothetical protein
VTIPDEIRRFCAVNKHVVMLDEERRLLLDVYSGKSLALPPIAQAMEKTTGDTAEKYVVVVFEDGRQIALAPTGIAWPPDPRNLPADKPLALPPVVCWRDFTNVSGQVQHVIEIHKDTPPSREVLDMLLYCIALLDGARAVGFDSGADEARVEGYLDEIERLGGPV